MTKANITQYSSTPSSNSDINDINIAENCPASNINNAIRELMAHLKNVYTGSQALTALSVTGETTLASHLNMGDNDKIKLGASGDLEIYHDTNHSYVEDTGTGELRLKTNGTAIRFQHGSETLSLYTEDGSVELFHDDSKKFETTSTGVNITGGIGLGGTGSANQLDDYEEGTWTPTAIITTGTGSVSSSNQVGQYTKIGTTVTCHFNIEINASSLSANVGISGLPFTCQSTSNQNFNSGIARRGIVGGEIYILEEIGDNTTQINVIRKFDNGGLSNGNQSINGVFTYTTNR